TRRAQSMSLGVLVVKPARTGHSRKSSRSTRRPHDSRESDPEAGEGARGAVRGPRPEDPGGAQGPAADGVSDNSSFVKASYFSVWRRLSPAILGGIGRYAWLAMPREASRDHEGVEKRGPFIGWTPLD